MGLCGCKTPSEEKVLEGEKRGGREEGVCGRGSGVSGDPRCPGFYEGKSLGCE